MHMLVYHIVQNFCSTKFLQSKIFAKAFFMLNFHESYYIIRKINDIFMIIFLQSSLLGKTLVSQKVQTIIYGTFHGSDLPDCPILVGYTNYTCPLTSCHRNVSLPSSCCMPAPYTVTFTMLSYAKCRE